MKGELVIRGEGNQRIWYVSTASGRWIVHSDDLFQHLVVGDFVEFELDHMSFARVKGSLSVRQACVNSLRLFFKIKKTVPLSALDTVNQKVFDEAGITVITDKNGRIVYHSDGSPMVKMVA
jgi:hypothetical protein